jgi:DNA invertase Pin-like site-specific DNA recombinase
MKYGYARVSTDNQDPALQLVALKKAGCRQTFTDHCKGIFLRTYTYPPDGSILT